MSKVLLLLQKCVVKYHEVLPLRMVWVQRNRCNFPPCATLRSTDEASLRPHDMHRSSGTVAVWVPAPRVDTQNYSLYIVVNATTAIKGEPETLISSSKSVVVEKE